MAANRGITWTPPKLVKPSTTKVATTTSKPNTNSGGCTKGCN